MYEFLFECRWAPICLSQFICCVKGFGIWVSREDFGEQRLGECQHKEEVEGRDEHRGALDDDKGVHRSFDGALYSDEIGDTANVDAHQHACLFSAFWSELTAKVFEDQKCPKKDREDRDKEGDDRRLSLCLEVGHIRLKEQERDGEWDRDLADKFGGFGHDRSKLCTDREDRLVGDDDTKATAEQYRAEELGPGKPTRQKDR